MTKPIIVVKICYKPLYVIQVVKRFLISKFLASTDKPKYPKFRGGIKNLCLSLIGGPVPNLL